MAHVELRFPPPASAAATAATAPSLLRRLWAVLEAFGERRALRTMRLSLLDPADMAMSAAERQAALEAAAVRRMADGYARTDRGFADDLYAAADRHERLAGADAPAPR